MTREKIEEAVNATFTDILEVPPEDLKAEAELFAGLGLDSLDMVDLMIGLQRKFGISLRQNEEIRKIVTLGDVYAFFEKMDQDLQAKGIDTSNGFAAAAAVLNGDSRPDNQNK